MATGIAPAQRLTAAAVPPDRLQAPTEAPVAALDRNAVAAGAARACLAANRTGPCLPQMDDLRGAARDVRRAADDLHLYAFGEPAGQ